MAQFYGTVCGNRGPASRTGSKKSGLRVAAQSWDGSVIIYMHEDRDTGATLIDIEQNKHTSSPYGTTIWTGTIEEFEDKLTKS